MAFKEMQPHFVLIPFLAQGHMIPMVDIAKLLAKHGVSITIITTLHNAQRFKSTVARAKEGGLPIKVLHLPFPATKVGLPEGCENFDMLPSMDAAIKFFSACNMLEEPAEELIKELKPAPSCIIADMGYPWTTGLAERLHIPRIVFHGMSCFSLLSQYMIWTSEVLETLNSDSECFRIPGLPDEIELTKAQIVSFVSPGSADWKELTEKVRQAETEAFGTVVNSFDELEPDYVREYRKARGIKVWCIGPVSLCNKDELDKAERGNKASIDQTSCLKWLDSKEPQSVLYACLGSLTRLATSQIIEIGLALEASNRPFVWVVRQMSDEFRQWLQDENFEERVRGRGLLIYGWAPQVLILSHRAVGGFLTHCGWNSTLEGITAAVPMITWPMFAEQFLNERLVINVLKTGLKSKVEAPTIIGEEEKVGVVLKKDDLKLVIDALMDEGEEAEIRRKRAKELGKIARKAVEEKGSSHHNMTLLIQDVMEQANLESHLSIRPVIQESK